MKEYLFMYPLEYFFDIAMDTDRTRSRADPKGINRTIDARYRNKGYGINWAVFCDEYDRSKPDLSDISEYVKIHKGDRLVVAGISFSRFMEKPAMYPDPYRLLEQIPKPERLVLGGFHAADCVKKVAEAAHARGLDVFVDEDTTNLFFFNRRQKAQTMANTGA